MTVSPSLLNTIPLPSQNIQTTASVPSVASVNVSDVKDDLPRYEEPLFENNFLNNFAQKIKQKIFEARMKKLENIPPEKRTVSQQAEIEANEKQIGYNTELDYMV